MSIVRLSVRRNKPIQCKHVHRGSCLLFAVKKGIQCSLAFKKIYTVVFAFKLIQRLNKLKSPTKLLSFYIDFFKRPCAFVFIYNFLARYIVCHGAKRNVKSISFIVFVCYIVSLSIFADKPIRARDLTVFLFGEFIQANWNKIKKLMKNPKKADDMFSVSL